MPRQARLIVPGIPHHIVQRGCNGRTVFHSDRDYQYYVDNLIEWKLALGVKVYSYCLMEDQVHIVVGAPEDSGAIPQLMKRLAGRQARYVNAAVNRSGSLWESRYRISPLDAAEYLHHCCRYVELYPLKAGLVDRAEDYLWSSCAVRTGEQCNWLDESPVPAERVISTGFDSKAYSRFLHDPSYADKEKVIRLATQRNKLIGGERFIDEVERRTGRRVEMRGQGRPRKAASQA